THQGGLTRANAPCHHGTTPETAPGTPALPEGLPTMITTTAAPVIDFTAADLAAAFTAAGMRVTFDRWDAWTIAEVTTPPASDLLDLPMNLGLPASTAHLIVFGFDNRWNRNEVGTYTFDPAAAHVGPMDEIGAIGVEYKDDEREYLF